MSAPSVERPRVIRRKIIVPDTPVGAVPRERLDGLLSQVVDAHRVVAVTATAGAGKSVAVAHASRRFNRPVAWLSVDATDAAPGRLVTYLEEALAQQLPSVRGIATGALAAGVPHAEAAGLLVDAAADAEVVFVLDDLERLHGSPPAWEVVGSVVRYGPPSMRLILISRRALGASVLSPALGAELARVGDADLAFTVEEAGIALQGLGRSGPRRRRRPRPGDKWHLDEVFVGVNGRLRYLWRAVDQDGNVLDILVQPRRDAKAAKRFFRKLLKRQCASPRVLVTDKLRS
jgi:ATP/maltotriose-dependent transcriptional regulator MalT